MNSRTPSVDTILAEAVEITDPAERRAFVEKCCAGDAALGRRVERLVADHFRAGSFLERPAANLGATGEFTPAAGSAASGAPGSAEGPGSVIGPYRLLEQIGEGGMGLVFVADQQQPVKRRVALKVVKPGMDTRQVIARFEAERQALAMMDHPNIAKIYDGGATSSGRPYFVMELVRGAPITAYCDQHRLPNRQRLRLFLDVCDAVQHAHQKGVIHRDLKPSNVMASHHDVTPVVKVIDFGIAKATSGPLTDRTVYTAFAQMVGTPLYMSPEQAGLSDLDVDTRSDVYALGVLLYELLTGTTPFDAETLRKAGYDEMRRIIREEEPPRPSARLSTLQKERLSTVAEQRGVEAHRLGRHVRGELDWVVMRCLEKDRNRRYESAGALAADLRRYLNDEPVQACPPSAAYRVRKFARRNKMQLAVAGLVLLFLVLLGGTIGWVLSDHAARQREAESKILEALETAEARLREGNPGDQALLTAAQRVEAHLGGAAVGPEVRRRAEQFLRDVRMLADLDGVRLREADAGGAWNDERNSEGRFDVSGTEGRYTEAFDRYGIDVLALDPADAAARIHDSAIHDALLAGLDGWIQATRDGDPKGALLSQVADAADDSAWRRSFREVTRPPDVEKLKALAAQPEALAQPPAVIAWLGEILICSGSNAEAADVLRAAQLRHPADFWINYQLAVASDGCSRPDEAVGYLRAAIAIRPGSAEAHSYLAYAEFRKGDFDAARVAYKQAIAVDPRFALARCGLGTTLEHQGDLNGAIASYQKAVELRPDFPEAYHLLANTLEAKGNHDDALAAYRKFLRLTDDSVVAGRHFPWFFYKRRAVVYFRVGYYDKALADIAKSIELEPSDVSALVWIGETEIAACPDKDFRKGMLALADQTVKVLSGKPDTEYGGEAEAYSVRARLLMAMNQPERASSDLERALLAIQKKGGAKPDDGPLAELGLSLLRMQKFAEAEPVLRECLAIREAHLPDDWRRFNTQSSLGGALLGQKKYAEAEPLLREGYEGMKRREGQIPPVGKARLTEAAERLVQFYEATNRPEKAGHWRQELERGSKK